jgi:hypothetical protein
MWLWISLITTVIGALANPFVSRLHATGLWAGKALASPENASVMPRGFQDALTDGWPSSLSFLGGLLPWLGPALGFLHSWWLPIPAFAIGIATTLAAQKIGPAPVTVDRYLALLYGHLARREANFLRDQDLLRFEAASSLRQELQQLLALYQGTGTAAPTMQLANAAPLGNREFLLQQR